MKTHGSNSTRRASPTGRAADRFAHSAGPGSLELRDNLDVWDVWDIWDVEDVQDVLDVFDDEMEGKCCYC